MVANVRFGSLADISAVTATRRLYLQMRIFSNPQFSPPATQNTPRQFQLTQRHFAIYAMRKRMKDWTRSLLSKTMKIHIHWIVRSKKCRHAVLESVTAYVAATRVADASRAAITLMIVPVGVLETQPLEVGRSSRAQQLTCKFRGYLCLKRPGSLVPFTPGAS